MRARGFQGLRFLLPLAAAASLSAIASTAHAEPAVTNGSGFDTHLFRPALDSKGFYATNGSDILGHTDFSLGLVIDYGRSLLRMDSNDATGQPTHHLIAHSFTGTFQFNFGLFNHVVVGLNVPVNLMVGDPQGSGAPSGWFAKGLDSQTLGFFALHAKWRITRVEKGFGLALAVQGGPTLNAAAGDGAADPGFFVWPQLIGEKRFGATGRFRIGLNAGFRAHNVTDSTIRPLRDGDTFVDGHRITYSLGLSYRVSDAVDLVLDTYGTYLLSSATGNLKPSNEVTGGIKLFVDRNSYFLLGGGTRYTNGFEAADGRAFIGFIFEPSIGDKDGDGYKDDVDKCPEQPEDFDGYKDEDGCPDPDNDNDGILDSRDKCPDVPEDRDGFQDTDGCPDPDNDQDGIPDKKDQCPNDPEDKDGFQDEDGCPDPDNDGDGIPDIKDKCPNEPETFNGFEDEDGCPDKGDVSIQGNDILILKKIKFKTASAEILPESNQILDAVATTLIHHPEFLLVEIAGHADERAPDDYNLKLTQDRVNSVDAALVARGVDRSRLRSKGYGEYCPEDPGHNEDAWEKNRRVEFKIVKTKDGPTGVELGCQNARTHGVNPDPVP